MCRFTLYLGQPVKLDQLITEPENSLIHQSFHSHEREEPLNGDGFGVVWYAPEESERPAVFRSISPAWSNRNLLQLARVIRSPCVLAHVRAATPGLPVAEANCHPFSAGRYAFMHNGEVGGFHQTRRALLGGLSDDAFAGIEGSTDSEHLFAMFLDRVRGHDGLHPADAMAQALRETIREVHRLAGDAGATEHHYLNIAVADGTHAVVTRYTSDVPDNADSLYYSIGRRYSQVGGATQMQACEMGRGCVIVSSERLSDDAGWEPVPVNHMVVIRGERQVRVEAV